MELNLQSNNISFLSSSAKLKSDTIYDVIIVGAGPAGYTAALYCLRKGILTGIIAKELGGKVIDTSMIENYTGIHSISGNDFAENIKKQVMQFPVNIESSATVTNIEEGKIKTIHQPVFFQQLNDQQPAQLFLQCGLGNSIYLPGAVHYWLV